MATSKRALPILAALSLGACAGEVYVPFGPDEGSSVDGGEAASGADDASDPPSSRGERPGSTPSDRPDARLWVLVHPADAPKGAGIYDYDIETGVTHRVIPIPEAMASPHALAFHEGSLWLLGWTMVGLGQTFYRIEPDSGTVELAMGIRGYEGEGLVANIDGSFWIGGDTFLRKFETSGLTRTIETVTMVHDLTTDGSYLYYVGNLAYGAYGGGDYVHRIDPASGTGDVLAMDTILGTAPYAIAHDGHHLVVCDSRYDPATNAWPNVLVRIDLTTGAEVDVLPLEVPGWITGLAFAK